MTGVRSTQTGKHHGIGGKGCRSRQSQGIRAVCQLLLQSHCSSRQVLLLHSNLLLLLLLLLLLCH